MAKPIKKSPKASPKPKAPIAPFLVGRDDEMRKIAACLTSNRSVLLEGPVGVGKTHLAIAATTLLARPVYRIDGDSRYTEQKLTGWFDPPTVMKRGFVKEAFTDGPLVEAMRNGGVLFINELNRLPEGVQNVLLPAIDEGVIMVPRLGEVRAIQGFTVIATQNPKEFVATSHLSEAILDRFELVVMDYQSEEDECQIVTWKIQSKTGLRGGLKSERLLPLASVRLARMTRNHPRVRRGASVRAAIGVAELTASLMSAGKAFEEAFLAAALMALPTRIEIERELESEATAHEETESLLREWAQSVLQELSSDSTGKKKT